MLVCQGFYHFLSQTSLENNLKIAILSSYIRGLYELLYLTVKEVVFLQLFSREVTLLDFIKRRKIKAFYSFLSVSIISWRPLVLISKVVAKSIPSFPLGKP